MRKAVFLVRPHQNFFGSYVRFRRGDLYVLIHARALLVDLYGHDGARAFIRVQGQRGWVYGYRIFDDCQFLGAKNPFARASQEQWAALAQHAPTPPEGLDQEPYTLHPSLPPVASTLIPRSLCPHTITTPTSSWSPRMGVYPLGAAQPKGSTLPHAEQWE